MAMLSQGEKDILKVLKNGMAEAESIPSLQPGNNQLDGSIASSEALLRSLGYESKLNEIVIEPQYSTPRVIEVRSFDELLSAANKKYPNEVNFNDILTLQEIAEHTAYVTQLNEEFNAVHRLDNVDTCLST